MVAELTARMEAEAQRSGLSVKAFLAQLMDESYATAGRRPPSLVTNPRRSEQSVAYARWLQSMLAAGVTVCVPENADYEVRRELLRIDQETF